jgi:mRNA interferase MazF
MEIKTGDIVLCEFYFSDLKTSKQRPVLVFKDNLPYGDFVGISVRFVMSCQKKQYESL